MHDILVTDAKRLVIKIGSSLIAARGSGLKPERIEQFADEITAIATAGRQAVVVSSGAIVSGIEKLRLKAYPRSLPVKQAAAAVGQSRLMWAYEKAFERAGRRVAQILLTHQDLADRRRFLNARHTLTTLLEFDIIPIINENDTVAVDEIRFGDNDSLAAEVAHLIDADLLIILSDVDGLFTDDPRRCPSATLIPLVEEVTADIERRAGASTTFEGTGGMSTTVQAAKKVAAYGAATLLMNGTVPGRLASILAGAQTGTLILPRSRRLTSRKHWIAHTLRSKGQIVVDGGAHDALVRRGKSLLASGIIRVEGSFQAGDAVTCMDQTGKEFAKGLVNISSLMLDRIKGLKTAEIRKTAGLHDYEEAIHRDNLVIL
jgi:glutamate 5-kinase